MEVSVRLKEVLQEEDEDEESENGDCGDEETEEEDDDDDEVGSFIFVKSIQNKLCCNETFLFEECLEWLLSKMWP